MSTPTSPTDDPVMHRPEHSRISATAVSLIVFSIIIIIFIAAGIVWVIRKGKEQPITVIYE